MTSYWIVCVAVTVMVTAGGLRLVTPPNSDKYAQESSRQFDEAYGLSFAQQLKNKVIYEKNPISFFQRLSLPWYIKTIYLILQSSV